MRKAVILYPVIFAAAITMAFVAMPAEITGMVSEKAHFEGSAIGLVWFFVLLVMAVIYIITEQNHRKWKKKAKPILIGAGK